jgi:serine/threonine protein phosphatase PrpC
MLSFNVAIMSETGGRDYNEDACGHWASAQQLCCVLADGAGGHGGGDIASRLAVTSLLTGFSQSPTKDGAELLALVRRVNQAVLDGREPTGVRRDMHTTVVSLVIDAVHGYADWAHCGDSRLYRFRGGRILEHTHDHSFVQSLLDAGTIQESEIRSHPKRSVLLSALGREQDELEASASSPSREVTGSDVFLLCSDGVWEYLTDDLLERSLAQAATPQEWLATMGDLIREATHDLPTHDNFTALTVWLQGTPSTWNRQ